MTRTFLDYMKSLRVQAPESINPVPVKTDDLGAQPEPEPDPERRWDVKLTAQGYPILPSSVMEKELSKAVCEKLMREYITQHYCTFISLIRADPSLMAIRSCQRGKESACAIWGIEEGNTSVCHGVLSSRRVHNQRSKKRKPRPDSKCS